MARILTGGSISGSGDGADHRAAQRPIEQRYPVVRHAAGVLSLKFVESCGEYLWQECRPSGAESPLDFCVLGGMAEAMP
jgi:hypothetical protein